MNSETRNCQNCKQDFVIEPDDFLFYGKMKAPPPTFCPECRTIRRMSWRNERTLYHRKCDATGKDIITMFAPEQKIVVYEHDYWWSDKWDQFNSGRDYDFSKPFFQQIKELIERAPLVSLANSHVVNSEYGNHNTHDKNCYLVYATYGSEDLMYSARLVGCKNSNDCYAALNLNSCYEIVLCGDMNGVFFSYDSDESVDSMFLHACKNITSSLACINLRSKSYNIFNKQYSKEDYKKELSKYDFGSYKTLSEFKKTFHEFIMKYPRRHGFIYKSVNTTGDNVLNAKNVHQSFDIFDDAQDSKYLIHAMSIRDSYDGYGAGGNLSNAYEVVDTGVDASNILFSVFTHSSQNAIYTYMCQNSSNLFGCIGLRSKKYCILNKQYTKEEYEELIPKVIQHMSDMPYVDEKGRVYKYGEFFPTELSPFAYNETIAQEYYPKTKDQVSALGHRWREPDVKKYTVTLKAADIPDHIKDVPEDITEQVIGCEHEAKCNEQCTLAFKITPQELQFYKNKNLPIPRLCPNCRHYSRLRQRTPFKLWDHSCDCGGLKSKNGIYQNTIAHPHGESSCPNLFQTSYSPNREEKIIYCDSCYKKEVF